jgi:hypothetical protein
MQGSSFDYGLAVILLIQGLQEVVWVILGPHSLGSMQVRIFKRRYSSSRTP